MIKVSDVRELCDHYKIDENLLQAFISDLKCKPKGPFPILEQEFQAFEMRDVVYLEQRLYWTARDYFFHSKRVLHEEIMIREVVSKISALDRQLKTQFLSVKKQEFLANEARLWKRTQLSWHERQSRSIVLQGELLQRARLLARLVIRRTQESATTAASEDADKSSQTPSEQRSRKRQFYLSESDN